jgi:protein MpaA
VIKKTTIFSALLSVSFMLIGCQKVQEISDDETHLIPVIKHDMRAQSVEGRSIDCLVYGSGKDVILIMATIHGDENAGTPLIYKLIDHLRANTRYLDNRKVVLMPVANPDGLAANRRYNDRGVDLNRNFEAANRKNNVVNGLSALSEPESRFIKDVIARHDPNRIVTLHESLACIDYDGPGKEIAEHMGKYCDLPVEKLGSRPGSLGSYAGNTLGIPIITVELTENDYWQDDGLWKRYGQMLLAAITYPQDADQSTQ